MEKKTILEALKKIRETKRKFKQSVDIVINLKNIDIKKDAANLEFYIPLTHPTGKKIKVAAFVGPELIEQAKDACDIAIASSDFDAYEKDKKKLKKLASTHDYFIAQATIMPKVATTFGRILGPKGKMPNPKAGCVIPPNANVEQVVKRLQNLIKLSAKKEVIFSCSVGVEDMDDNHIFDNVMTVYNQVIHHLPQEKNNIRSVFLKLTMSKAERID
ncbi:MAG: 50S ribosomal protein L1 [Nanoarchaeota archaeon]